MNKFNLTSIDRVLFISSLFYILFLVINLNLITAAFTDGNLSKAIGEYFPFILILLAVMLIVLMFSPKNISVNVSGEIIIIKSENIIWRKLTSSYNTEITIKKTQIVESYEASSLFALKKHFVVITKSKNKKIKYRINISGVNNQNFDKLKHLLK